MIELNLATDYTIRILIHLAQTNKAITATEVAGAMKIPERQSAALLKNLCKRGVVEGHRGRNGGYMLKTDPQSISLLDIIQWTSSSVVINRCVQNKEECNRKMAEKCKVHKVFCELQLKWEKELKAVTLINLI